MTGRMRPYSFSHQKHVQCPYSAQGLTPGAVRNVCQLFKSQILPKFRKVKGDWTGPEAGHISHPMGPVDIGTVNGHCWPIP